MSSPTNTSSVCTRFVHNAWKKDFCSNCFKSKEEHKTVKASTKQPLKQHQPDATPSKSSIKNSSAQKKKKYKVSFPKEVSEVIGFGGEWADSDHSSDDEEALKRQQEEEQQQLKMMAQKAAAEALSVEIVEQDYSKVTKSNTEFNTNINNLLASPTPSTESNIKRSFAALKLGTSSSPKETKKETLKITVLPFSTNSNKSHSKVTEIKQIFGSSASLNGSHPPPSPATKKSGQLTVSSTPLTNGHKTEVVSSCKVSTVVVNPPAMEEEAPPTTVTGPPVVNNSPEIVSVTEKSLLEEISETLEKNKSIELTSVKPPAEVVDAVPKRDAIRLEIKNPLNKVLPTTVPAEKQEGTVNNSPAGAKRPINRNVPITKDHVKPKISVFAKKFDLPPKEDDSDVSDLDTLDFYENVKGTDAKLKSGGQKNSSFFSSQLISDMFLTNKPISRHLKSVHSEVYDLSERTYGKITSDGLIMTKSLGTGDANDSHTSSNFDSSSSSSCSDEETNQRSESDSGIVANEYQNVVVVEQQKTVPEEEEGFFYDDVVKDTTGSAGGKKELFSPEKSRELAGEPDGSSETDSNSEVPALPSSSPPPSFGEEEEHEEEEERNVSVGQGDKPKVPLKPNGFLGKTNAKDLDEVDHQEETQRPVEKLTVSRESSLGSESKLKKGRAPNPPPSPEMLDTGIAPLRDEERSVDTEINTIYMRNPMANLKSSSPVIREKDKRGRATINPKFRSLNSINSFQKNVILNRATTPEPMPRKSLSMSHEDLLLDAGGVDGKTKSMKKTKLFSIKKFLRMGSSSTTNLHASSTSLANQKLSDIPVETRSENGDSPKAKPRLVIIHPIDINPSAVEVVKTPTSCTSTPDIPGKLSDDHKIVSGKPPAPPIRATSIESSKPNRPPPPKSVETRRKQQEHIVASQEIQKAVAGAKVVDTVYANLGEVRSAIAPRKPERTASMREREERQLELMKRRAAIKGRDPSPTEHQEQHLPGQVAPSPTMACQGKLPASKVEIFERNLVHGSPQGSVRGLAKQSGVEGIKSSVQKMTSTIDNYLKDRSEDHQEQQQQKQQDDPRPVTNLVANKFNSTNSILKDYGSSSSPSPGVAKKMHFSESVEMRHYEPVVVSQKQDRMSLPDVMDSVYGSATNLRQVAPKGPPVGKGFGQLPRAISMSYCGSEMGESEIYSPYSFCGSEAGGDVAYEDPQFGWNTGSVSGGGVIAAGRWR